MTAPSGGPTLSRPAVGSRSWLTRRSRTLTKGAKRVDAELLYHGEHGGEVQFAHEGVMSHAQRFVLREQAVREAEQQRARLLREGWTEPATSPPMPSEP